MMLYVRLKEELLIGFIWHAARMYKSVVSACSSTITIAAVGGDAAARAHKVVK